MDTRSESLAEAARRIHGLMGHLTEDALGIYGPEEVLADLEIAIEDGTADGVNDRILGEQSGADPDLLREALRWYRKQLEKEIPGDDDDADEELTAEVDMRCEHGHVICISQDFCRQAREARFEVRP